MEMNATNIAQIPPDKEMSTLYLIALGLEKGVDPDRMTKLYDLHERHEKNIAVKAYNEAMQRCQEEMSVIVCDSFNPQTKSKYASVESMNRKIKPVYTRNGIALSFNEETSPIPSHCRTTCEVMHVQGHSKHYHLDLPLDGIGIKGNANMTAIHGRLSSDTYAQGRLLRKIFNLTIADDNTDTDGNEPEPLADEHWHELNTLLEETGHLAQSDKLKKFLAWLDIPAVSSMTMPLFPKAIDALKRLKAKDKTNGAP